MEDAICSPRQILRLDNSLLPDTFRRRNPRHPHVGLNKSNGGYSPKTTASPQTVIWEPCFYLDGEHTEHFGHLTLEVVSRLWGLRHCPPDIKIATSCRKLQMLEGFLKPFGINRDRIVQIKSPVLFKNLIISSQSYYLEGSASPQAYDVWRTIGDYYERPDTPRKVYISRSKWLKQRTLENEENIETTFKRSGYTVIHPEELPFSDQVAIFRGAREIAGPSGSGMYNCVYCQKETNVTLLASENFITPNDALIHSMIGSNVRYLVGRTLDDDQNPMFANWVLDEDLVSEALRET